ncbi:MAG TPA: prepilin-type N-terminal cleavage/methylation domain-containing protein [Phycisphaerales bacterium]|nr:prepilin-type N-terminal cleavage/methylation domain-containing protein [Phycisphaerales bacterium]
MKVRSQQQTADRRETIDRGFTLIEIIVVITIIAILTSLGLMVGNKVRVNSQAQATRSLLISLDQAYTAVTSEKDSGVASVWRDALGNEFAVVDGYVKLSSTPEPSLGLLLLATGQHPSLKETILRADSRYLTTAILTSSQNMFPTDNTVKVPVLKDSWGNPIRFVHPRWDGGYGEYYNPITNAQVTTGRDQERQFVGKRAGGGTHIESFLRSFRPTQTAVGHADEGLCTGGRGYFYSSGPDKDPGARDDNVYLNGPPKFPAETANFH